MDDDRRSDHLRRERRSVPAGSGRVPAPDTSGSSRQKRKRENVSTSGTDTSIRRGGSSKRATARTTEGLAGSVRAGRGAGPSANEGEGTAPQGSEQDDTAISSLPTTLAGTTSIISPIISPIPSVPSVPQVFRLDRMLGNRWVTLGLAILVAIGFWFQSQVVIRGARDARAAIDLLREQQKTSAAQTAAVVDDVLKKILKQHDDQLDDHDRRTLELLRRIRSENGEIVVVAPSSSPTPRSSPSTRKPRPKPSTSPKPSPSPSPSPTCALIICL